MDKEKKYFIFNTADYKDYKLASAECDNGKILFDTVKIEEEIVFEIKSSQIGELLQLLPYFDLEIKEVDPYFIKVKVNDKGGLW